MWSNSGFKPHNNRIGFVATGLLMILLASMHSSCNAQQSAKIPVQEFEFIGFQTQIPTDWNILKPSSSMRAAQIEIPASRPLELVVFYFGPGQGGPVAANIARWQGQFRLIDGKSVQPKVSQFTTAGNFTVNWIELRGDYARGVGMGPVGEYQPDQMLIAAITQTPKGNLYIQLHGQANDVTAHRAAYRAFVEELHPVERR